MCAWAINSLRVKFKARSVKCTKPWRGPGRWILKRFKLETVEWYFVASMTININTHKLYSTILKLSPKRKWWRNGGWSWKISPLDHAPPCSRRWNMICLCCRGKKTWIFFLGKRKYALLDTERFDQDAQGGGVTHLLVSVGEAKRIWERLRNVCHFVGSNWVPGPGNFWLPV